MGILLLFSLLIVVPVFLALKVNSRKKDDIKKYDQELTKETSNATVSAKTEFFIPMADQPESCNLHGIPNCKIPPCNAQTKKGS